MLTWRRFEPARPAEPMLSRGAASRKRKEMEATERVSGGARVEKEVEVKGNQLLAGYLAHEFLTKGTLMGQRWEPAVRKPVMKHGAAAADRAKPAPMGSYADVAQLVKAEGAYVPGVVNPAQLAGWLQMETRPEPTRSDPFQQIL